MKNRNGFTLTEVLLAVMIVGLIGVALASLTTAASRESGAGSSRVMLRNNLSTALRQLRRDVHDASRVLHVSGALAAAPTEITESQPGVPLLVLAKNMGVDGAEIRDLTEGDDQEYIAYCFVRGTTAQLSSGQSVQPEGKAFDGGRITRSVWNAAAGLATDSDFCPLNTTGRSVSVWLDHVKFISSEYTTNYYPVPLFNLTEYDGTNTSAEPNKGALLNVNLIVELPSYPVVNETVGERILLSNGGTW